jgi:beta-glucosidase
VRPGTRAPCTWIHRGRWASRPRGPGAAVGRAACAAGFCPALAAALASATAAGMVVLVAAGCAAPLAPRRAAALGDVGDDPVARARALVARLTLEEEVAQLQSSAPAIPRLGIPAYDWWSESLHGVARNGTATVFPQVIGLAATFDEDLMRRVAEAIAEEARAKFDAIAGPRGDRGTGTYQGLTFFAPNINLFRDPRWGRGQETFGEDPFLTARLGVAYVRGMQGRGDRAGDGDGARQRLTVAAVAKHFAVHSGPERERHHFDARVGARDLAESYLPQFEAVVREGKVAGIMAAYNAINGVPAVANHWLLGDVLRGAWGFDGFVVGDCGAVGDLVGGHRLAADDTEAAVRALRAGTDLDCGRTYHHLLEAARAHPARVSRAELDAALVRLFTVRFRLGVLDPAPGQARVESRADEAVEALLARHRALAREAARRSIVLLANAGDVLPLAGPAAGAGAGPDGKASPGPGLVRRLAVIGPVADDVDVLLGNYHGTPADPITLLRGVRAEARARGIAVEYVRGVTLAGPGGSELAAAEAAARSADVVIACLGISPALEGEEGDPHSLNPEGDRRDLGLPGLQGLLLRRLLATGTRVVVVLTGGGAIALPAGANPAAVLMAWYPGQEGGAALADVLFGADSPSGRLPVTFYLGARDLPSLRDYSMRGRTYRYFGGRVAYGFGHGLGYGALTRKDLAVSVTTGSVDLSLSLVNPGPRAIHATVPVFIEAGQRQPGDPRRTLVAFRGVDVAPGATVPLGFRLPLSAFHRTDADGVKTFVPGQWLLRVGDLDAPPVTVEVPSPPSAPPPASKGRGGGQGASASSRQKRCSRRMTSAVGRAAGASWE